VSSWQIYLILLIGNYMNFPKNEFIEVELTSLLICFIVRGVIITSLLVIRVFLLLSHLNILLFSLS